MATAGRLYSTRFLSVSLAPGQREADAIVPAGVRWVIRTIDVFSDVPPVTVDLAIANFALVAKIHLADTTSPETGRWRGRLVLYSGETLQVSARESSANVTVCGYELLGP